MSKQLAAFFGIVLLSNTPVSTAQDGSVPFRSELWQLEYSETEERRELPFVESSDDSSLTTSRSAGVSGDDGSLNISLNSIPGTVTLEQLNEETPIAEMHASNDRQFGDEDTVFDNSPTAWKRSRVDSGERDPYDVIVPHGDGPSAITYLVGLLAVVVVIGALLTGRD